MPITTSAKKALRQNIKRRSKNLRKKDAYKTAINEYKKLIPLKNTDEAKQKLSLVFKSLDKAAKTNVITKNKASRLKSRLARRLK